MTWYPTNADDVTLIVSEVIRNEDGSRSGSTEIANTNAITVDDFTIGTEEDLTGLSGVGNANPLGVSQGDIEHSFDFTVQGEDAEVFNSLAEDDSGRAKELEIIAKAEDYKAKLVGAYAGTREFSGSSGDPVEYAAEGIATGRDDGTV
jgi:hypothetical protein